MWRYAVMFDDGDIYTGSESELGKQYFERYGYELRLTPDGKDEDGYDMLKAELVDWNGDAEHFETICAQDTEEENIAEAFYCYFSTEIYGGGDDFSTYRLETPEQEDAFVLDVDELLDNITAREARDAGLDLDNEKEVREFYYHEKAAA